MRLMFRRTPPPTVGRWIDGTEDLDDVTVVPTPGTPGHVVAFWDGWLLAGGALITGQRFPAGTVAVHAGQGNGATKP